MAERRQRSRLAFEAHEAIGIVCQRLRDHLESHIAPQLLVTRAIDFAHATEANQGHDLVGADPRAGG
jgi:hypothetical protein